MIDTDALNIEELIKSIGIDKEIIIELLSIYCSEIHEEMQQIKLLLEKKAWSDMQRTIHNIKGVSANLYLEKMFEAAGVIDNKLKNNDYIDIECNIQNLLDTFDYTVSSIHLISEQHA